MRRIVLILALAVATLAVWAVDVSHIVAAFKSGRTQPVAAFMDSEVDVAVPGASKKCLPAEAVAALDAFFGANSPAGFTVAHNAEKKESGFLVGKLTAGGREFRVNLTYRISDGKAVIQSVRIE
ncbi:MAG: DUF4783 domain-containing protein [Tannerellaceae bacterium]|jgi:hypothetical protein|nr:DUF4783 domain-containing protein [Tannerellaceae bacterium]